MNIDENEIDKGGWIELRTWGKGTKWARGSSMQQKIVFMV